MVVNLIRSVYNFMVKIRARKMGPLEPEEVSEAVNFLLSRAHRDAYLTEMSVAKRERCLGKE